MLNPSFTSKIWKIEEEDGRQEGLPKLILELGRLFEAFYQVLSPLPAPQVTSFSTVKVNLAILDQIAFLYQSPAMSSFQVSYKPALESPNQ